MDLRKTDSDWSITESCECSIKNSSDYNCFIPVMSDIRLFDSNLKSDLGMNDAARFLSSGPRRLILKHRFRFCCYFDTDNRIGNRKNVLADTIFTKCSACSSWCQMVIKKWIYVRCWWLGIVWFLHREPGFEANTLGFYNLWRLVGIFKFQSWRLGTLQDLP